MVLSTSIMIITLKNGVFLKLYPLKLRKDLPTTRVTWIIEVKVFCHFTNTIKLYFYHKRLRKWIDNNITTMIFLSSAFSRHPVLKWLTRWNPTAKCRSFLIEILTSTWVGNPKPSDPLLPVHIIPQYKYLGQGTARSSETRNKFSLWPWQTENMNFVWTNK
jgi:hypothetical protein